MVLLLALAVRFFLGRYEMVYNEHGTFLVGVDYVDQYIGLPLQWLVIVACLAAAVLVWMRRWLLAACDGAGAGGRRSWCRGRSRRSTCAPNEISLERPYIQTHIHATRSAFGIEQRVREVEFKAQPDAPIDAAQQQGHAR